jgi:hypothetical protein
MTSSPMTLRPIETFWTLPFAVFMAAGILGTTVEDARACACCTNQGQRRVESIAIDSGVRQQFEELQFADKATLYVGEADVDDVKGITTPSASYALKASWQDNQLVFNLRDAAGRSGTLTLPRPATAAVFEVDPRANELDGGTGPTLYKEWKLTAKPTGTGVFEAGTGPQQLLTLIVQGRGNSCTSSSDFTHWTLVMQGPKGNYTLFGNLSSKP